MLWGCYRRFRQKDKIGLIKKIISNPEIFRAGKPSKTVNSENRPDSKSAAKPYAATISEDFKT
jgi:hypothetical protein